MKVLKFGGTSVGSVKSILSLKRIVETESRRQPVVVVVSALGGITDKLIATSQLALKGDESYREVYSQVLGKYNKKDGIEADSYGTITIEDTTEPGDYVLYIFLVFLA